MTGKRGGIRAGLQDALIGILILWLAPFASAQDEPATFTSEAYLVTLHVSVLDKKGNLVTNLPESAFKVYEDNVEQRLKVFKREDVPVSMGILLDNSASMAGKRAAVAAAAKALIRESNPQDEEFVVNFNDQVFQDQGFTNDPHKLEAALDKLDSRGGTAMRNAISLSLGYMKTDAKKDKKVLVVVTDGNDNSSPETPLEKLVREVRATNGILIYSIGLLSEENGSDAREARHALKLLAQASGGLDYYPKNVAQVETITPQIAREIRNQYTLAYTPMNPTLDGKFRSIKVQVKGYGNVRAKNGYYATPAASGKP
jgi:Ca-activated chloride channel homolog